MNELVFGWPEIIYIALTMLGLGVTLVKGDGVKIFSQIIALIIIYSILYWGGFFS